MSLGRRQGNILRVTSERAGVGLWDTNFAVRFVYVQVMLGMETLRPIPMYCHEPVSCTGEGVHLEKHSGHVSAGLLVSPDVIAALGIVHIDFVMWPVWHSFVGNVINRTTKM